MNTRTRIQRVVLAYSGGLNSTVVSPWLATASEKVGLDRAPVDVVTISLDVGQGGELEEVRDRALATGAVRAHVLDVRDEFARDYITRALKADALADDRAPMGPALAAPLIAKKLVEIAGIEQAVTVAHGASDRVAAARFEAAVRALNPNLTVLAPARDWNLTRLEAIEYANIRNITIPVTVEMPHSSDANAWGRSVAADATDAWDEPPEDLYALTMPASACPSEPAYVEVAFERGVPVAVNGVSMPLIDIIGTVGMIAGSHGVGRLDIAATRAGREIGEAPAAAVLHAAHVELQRLVNAKDAAKFSRTVSREYADVVERGAWFSPLREALDAYVDRMQERVSGAIRLKLFKGDSRIVGRKPVEAKPAARRLRVLAAKTH
jgi:argininosuccinate synthase